ncbi:MAG: hypothetical protein ACI86H_000948 [bacterium]|jgi:hypothetical protein
MRLFLISGLFFIVIFSSVASAFELISFQKAEIASAGLKEPANSLSAQAKLKVNYQETLINIPLPLGKNTKILLGGNKSVTSFEYDLSVDISDDSLIEKLYVNKARLTLVQNLSAESQIILNMIQSHSSDEDLQTEGRKTLYGVVYNKILSKKSNLGFGVIHYEGFGEILVIPTMIYNYRGETFNIKLQLPSLAMIEWKASRLFSIGSQYVIKGGHYFIDDSKSTSR